MPTQGGRFAMATNLGNGLHLANQVIIDFFRNNRVYRDDKRAWPSVVCWVEQTQKALTLSVGRMIGDKLAYPSGRGLQFAACALRDECQIP